MNVDVSILISALSLVISAVVGFTAIRNNNSSNDRQEASQLTMLIVKLENIAEGINEIKSEMGYLKGDVKDLRDRLIVVEQSTKSAHKRIDDLGNDEHSK